MRGQRLVRHVQRHDDQRHTGFEHDVSRMRVYIDVELCRRRDVATEIASDPRSNITRASPHCPAA